jgi:hypothetical protein
LRAGSTTTATTTSTTTGYCGLPPGTFHAETFSVNRAAPLESGRSAGRADCTSRIGD